MEAIRTLDSYSMDELKRLYKSFLLYLTTDWMKYCKRYRGENYVYDNFLYNKEDEPHFLSFLCGVDELHLEIGKYKNEREKQFLEHEVSVLHFFREIRYWFHGIRERHKQSFMKSRLDHYKSRCRLDGKEYREEDYDVEEEFYEKYGTDEELEDELHINDAIDREYGRATKYEIMQFVWETLRFCDYNELSKLVKLADNKFEFNQRHRPRFNKKIYKYDLEGNLVAEFENRAECIEKDGISKNALSMVLSGKRKQYKGFKYTEEE